LDGSSTLPAIRISQLDLTQADAAMGERVASWVFAEFDTARPEDKTAKDSAFIARLKTNWTVASTAAPVVASPTSGS
jgi:hypothetical protein